MANSISGNGSNTITVNNMRYTADFTTAITPVGSSSIAESFLINTGSYQAVDTGSVSNVSKIFLDNPSGPGTVQFATSSNAGNSIATLLPGDWAWLSLTGSYPLYAKALDSASYINVIIAPR